MEKSDLESYIEEINSLKSDSLLKQRIKIKQQEWFFNFDGKIPSNWYEANFMDVTWLITCGVAKKPDYVDEGIPFLSAQNTRPFKTNLNKIKYISQEAFKKLTVGGKPEKNDILYTRVGNCGEAASIPYEFDFGVYVSLTLIKPIHELINHKFLVAFLNSSFGKIQANAGAIGIGLKNLNVESVRKFKIPLPPLLIQRAIVSKIEALFSDLDNGIANFKKAQAQLKIYRQAVLKKAFDGELTNEWREKQTNLPTAEELLKQIKEERQNHYNQQIEDWKKMVKEWEKKGSVGKKPSKPTQPKELPPLKKDELEELAILPFGWTWCRIAEIGSVETGATPKRGNLNYWENGSIPWITSGALNDDFVRECKEYVTEQALKETNIKVFPKHSLVMAMYGEGKTRGKSSELLIDTSTNQAIACIIQKNTESKTKNYLKSFLVKIYQDIRRKSSGGVQPNINLDIVKNLNLPFCSLEEQNQIVQEIESRLSVCDKMEQSINESIEKAEALRQSILKKAFEGKLLSQAEIELCKKESDYEPASELLKKIQAEKLAKELEKKKPTVKKKSKK
jgi:type I restriction enzyme S subunit